MSFKTSLFLSVILLCLHWSWWALSCEGCVWTWWSKSLESTIHFYGIKLTLSPNVHCVCTHWIFASQLQISLLWSCYRLKLCWFFFFWCFCELLPLGNYTLMSVKRMRHSRWLLLHGNLAMFLLVAKVVALVLFVIRYIWLPPRSLAVAGRQGSGDGLVCHHVWWAVLSPLSAIAGSQGGNGGGLVYHHV